MLTKQQITEVKNGIKLAVKQINLESDKLFAETDKEIKSIERKIATITNKEKSYLTTVGYNATLNSDVTNLNLQSKDIHNFIYSRLLDVIIDMVDVNKIAC